MSALFANEKSKSENPFYDEPEPRAFYHPTLPKKAQGISLSPDRLKSHLRASVDQQHVKGKELSPGEKGFLSGSNTMLAKELPTHDTPSPGPADTSSKFDESWPASERPSTIESPGNVQNVSSTSAATSHGTGSGSSPALQDPMTDSMGRTSDQIPDSTLARLIDRFRFSAPRSREERARLPATGSKDFWWLSSSSSSLPHPSRQPSSSSISRHAPIETTPVRGTGPVGVRGVEGARRGTGGGRGRGRGASRIPSWSGVSRSGVSSLSGSRRASGVSTLSSSSSSSLKRPSSGTDKETEEIQRRAEKLLEISEGTILSDPAVSSDGLGSFSTSSPITDDTTPPRDHEGYASRFHNKENLPRPPLFPANLSHTQRPQQSEEDILQQWRMRRRMEQAKEGALHRVSGRMTHGPLRQTQAENIGTRKDGTAINEDADSKLADFRRRLQQQKLLTEARVASNVQQVPAKDATTTHTGTDPIPHSIATQTGRRVPYCIQSGSQSLSSDQTTCLQQERTLRRDTMQEAEEELPLGQSEYQVASPNVKSVGPQRGREPARVPDVTPHLHMSCDILPCDERGPHMHTVRDVKDKVEFVGHGKKHHHQTETDYVYDDSDLHFGRQLFVDKPGNMYNRHTLVPSNSQRVSSIPEASHHQEKRQKYEPESRTDEAERHSRRYEGHHVGDDIRGEDITFQYDLARKNPERTSSKGFLGKEPIRSGRDESQILDAEQQTAAAEDTRTAHQPQAPTTRTETLENSIAATGTSGMDAGPVTRQQMRTDDADDTEGAKCQLDFGSSSPINNAIGQVISNRMFSSPVGRRSIPSSQRSTPSTIRSSALSQDTLMFTPPMSDRVISRQRMSTDDIPEPVDTVDSRASSDSEEFKNDEMLQVLRNQREECIRQLNHLDNLLSHTSKD